MDLDTLGCLLIEVDFPALVEQYNHSMAQMGVMPRCAVYNLSLIHILASVSQFTKAGQTGPAFVNC